MTDQSYARQRGFVEKAEEAGKLVYKGEMDDSTRRMGFSLVKLAENGVGETGGLVEEEIFGAVVPIIPVSVRSISTVTMRLHVTRSEPRCNGNRSRAEPGQSHRVDQRSSPPSCALCVLFQAEHL